MELLVPSPENYEQEVATYTLSGEEQGVAEVTGDLIILDEDLDEHRDALGEDVLASEVFAQYDGQPALIADCIGRVDPEQ